MTRPSPERPAFHQFVARHRRLLLTTHINPDGDGLGSEIAMALWLESLGKTVRILNDSPLPSAFTYFDALHRIEEFTPALAEECFTVSDALIVLDTSNRQRTGRVGGLLDHHLMPVAVVDHHTTHAQGFGQVNVIEPECSSTGEMVFELIREAGGTMTPAMADALYVALMTDTGSFRYSNTDSRAHRMAADLLDHGLDPQAIHTRILSHASPGRIRFFGEVLGALEMHASDRLVVMEANPEHFERHGLKGADTEGLVDLPRSIAGVDVVALFSEVDRGKVKVSLRSNGRVSIDHVVARLGGGGHPHAAGAMLKLTRAEARERVVPELVRLVEGPVVASGSR